ncbi:helix-turn-helix domain-containing protein [Streptomyces sp. NPDC051105]|uniref:Crp/Fnr family transcriptional regulator n=1 Tax=Streptomyces sp. NPDC051105 TaxID=3154843 RepID=UPI00341C6680
MAAVELPTVPESDPRALSADPDAYARVRRNRIRRVLSRFFDPYRVQPEAIDILTDLCRLHDRGSGNDDVLSGALSRRSTRCVFLYSGYVVTDPLRRTSRLWKGRSFFGTSHVWDEGVTELENPQVVSRGPVTALSLPGRALREAVLHEPTLGVALLRMTFEQQQITEVVYGASNEIPLVRVARMLDYLAVSRSVVVKAGGGKTVVTSQRKKLIVGPTQTDIADALGMGRATVEKALATLRKEGVLMVTPPGQHRKNRHYEIADEEKLKLIAMGVTTPN